MTSLSKFTGSILVASLLFSITGCGDDDTKASTSEKLISQSPENITKNTPLTQKEQLEKTLASKNDFLSREMAKNPNLKLATIIATLLSPEKNKLITAKEYILKNGDEEAIKILNTLNESEINENFVIDYFEYTASQKETQEKSFKQSSQKLFGNLFDGIKDKIIDPIKDKVIDPIKETVEDKIIDPIKDAVVDAIDDNKILSELTNQAFILMLKSGTATKEALRLAIKSDTVMEIMIVAMDDHWNLAEQMQPLLENDVNFGHLFMDLAMAHPVLDSEGVEHLPMAEFLFSRIDAPMYKSLTIAMTNSRKDINNGSAGKVTSVLSALMARPEMTKFFQVPDNLNYTDGQTYQAFSKLLFTNGTPEIHGDGAELANERFFYEMFATPESTGNFITAMQGVDVVTRTALMNQIFLGENETLENDDEAQGDRNIYAVTGGMAYGLGEGAVNFDAYQDHFLGFAGLITEGDYLDVAYNGGRYALAFGGAAYNYFDNNDSSYAEDFATLISGTTFDTDQNDSLASYYNDLGGIVGEYTDKASALGEEGLAYYNDVAFDELFLGTTRLQFFTDIPKENLSTFKTTGYLEYKFFELYGSTNTWDYIPNKFSEKDWLNKDAIGSTAQFDFASGTIVAYLVSTASLETVKEETGLTTLVAIDLAGDAPLSSDVNASYNIYTFNLENNGTVDFSLYVTDSISAVFFDSDDATPNASELEALNN